MKRCLKSLLFLSCGAIFGAPNSVAQSAPPPAIFFTDLTSGPNTGGENNNGTILTIYGKNFGATRGSSTVTVGGGAVAAYLLWGGRSKAASATAQLETISVAIGSAAATGTVVVTTAAGASTCFNAQDNCQFTVRPGNIRCVSTTGSDSNNGNFPSGCWASIVKAKNSITAGDIAYIENGVTASGQDNYNSSLFVGSSGTAANPYAIVGYPGATATISNNGLSYGLRFSNAHYWTFANLVFSGTGGEAIEYSPTNSNLRVVGNELTCPKGAGQAACHHADQTTYVYFYGNYVHNVGDSYAGGIDKFYHAVYFTTNSNHIWMGWNEVNNNPTGSTTSGSCRAVQFYSTGGANQFDLHVFNNYIHNAICDGINFATVNAAQGTVEAFNNVVYHVGTGPDPTNGSSNYSCVNTGGSGGTSVLIYNNTFYDCGGRKNSDSGTLAPSTAVPIAATNNIIYQLSGESYINPNANPSNLSGTNNVWFGLGNGPTQTTGNVNSDPLLVNPATDFHLRTGSAAVDAGAMRSLSFDFEGTKRPQGAGLDIGAYEYFAGGTTVQRPNPPTNLTVVVH